MHSKHAPNYVSWPRLADDGITGGQDSWGVCVTCQSVQRKGKSPSNKTMFAVKYVLRSMSGT